VGWSWDQQTCIYLSTAQPALAWSLLDRLGPERFRRVLQAKLQMPASLTQEQLQQALSPSLFELLEAELHRDSRPRFGPGRRIEEEELDWAPALAKLAHVLHQLRPNQRRPVVNALEPSLAERVQGYLDNPGTFSVPAGRRLCQLVKFDPELFDCFARRASTGVAEWLLDRLFYGVRPVGRLCEISPLKIRSYAPGKGLNLRHLKKLPPAISLSRETDAGLSRIGRLAILLMSLPPEISAQLFKNFGPDMVHEITLEISKLPEISPQLREQVIVEVTGLVPEELESAAKDQVEAMAEFLRRYLMQDDEASD